MGHFGTRAFPRYSAAPCRSLTSCRTGSKTGAQTRFNILPPWLPTGLTDFVDLVIPELQRHGLFRTEYECRTLHENLGLPFPINRHAAGSAAQLAAG